jgi:hypothetical protein
LRRPRRREGLARLSGLRGPDVGVLASRKPEPEGSNVVIKKLLIVALLCLSAFAVWRKVQADRAELDLWTEATTSDN